MRAGIFHVCGSQEGEQVQDRAPGAARYMHRAKAVRPWLFVGALGGGPLFATLFPRGGLPTSLRNSGLGYPVPGDSGSESPLLRGRVWPSRAPCWPTWSLLGSAAATELRSGKTLPGKPRSVTSSLVTSPGPRGVREFRGFRRVGFPGTVQGSRQGLQRVFTAPCVCPTGPARPRVRPARAPAGAMGRSGSHCCCPPPAHARLEPRRRQPPTTGPQVTLAAPGSVARARGHVEEPSVQ